MAKENDFFLNTVENPTFNPIDFASVGLNAGNTSIEPKDTYENIDAIKLMDQFQTNGAYDPHKFDAFYNLAAYGFNRLADLDTAELIANEPTFYKYDITVPLSERKLTPDFVVKKVANPLRQRVGFQDFNLKEAPEYTVDEIAQTNKVYDVETGKWIDSPNDTWLENFLPGNAKVLATYDEDTVDTDPITGELVQHKKGDLKLNDNGEPYYETLGKRSIYDKKVLSGFDTLTVDGSTWNKFDFMDSDSKDKSIGGTLVKNAIKIVPAFVSGVSPIYIGARIALNAADLFAKAGKMLTGSDNSFLTGVEAFNKLWTTGASEYSQGDQYFGTLTAHAWSMENLLNVGADVFTQLAEQRFLFHQVPALMKGTGKLGYDLATRKKFVDTEADKFMDEHIHNVLTLAKNSKNVGKDLEAAKQFAYKAAESKLTAIDESLSKIGENISKAYMTGITVADSYGEAKNSGASDLEAALFTLGYATGEWKLLNTGIGEHILPELRANKIKLRQSLKKYLYGTAKEIKPSGAASAAEKATWARKWMQKGQSFFKSLKDFDVDDSVLASVSKMTAAHSLGEGLEEVSEEALLDMSKALFDGIAWLRGDDTRLGPFDNYNLSSVINRYGLSLVGGAMGGALSNFLPGMNTFQDIKSPASMEEAHRILVEAVASGKKNDLLKIINDTTWGPRSLSATLTLTKDGITTYAAGTELDNWDASIKRVLTQSINNIENILSANGINMSKDLQAFLTERTIPEFRKLALGASVSKYYANLYYKDLTTLTELLSKIDAINKGTTAEGASSSTDSSAKAAAKTTEVDGATSGTLSQLESRLAKVKERLTKYNDGTMRSSYTRDILYQLSPAFTSSYWVDPEIGGNLPSDFLTYINYKYGISPDALPEYIKKDEQKFWEDAKQLDEPERVHLSRLMFDKFNEHVSKTLGQHAEEYYHQATKQNFFDSIQLEFYNPSSKNELLEGEQIDPLTGETRTEGTEAKLTKLGESGSDDFISGSEGYLDVKGIQPDVAIGKELGISNSRKWRTLSEMNKFLKDSPEVSDEAKKLLESLDALPKISGYAQVLQALKADSEKVFNNLKDLKISESGITIQEDFWNYVTDKLNKNLAANKIPAEDIKSFNTEKERPTPEEPLTVELAKEFVQWYNKKNNSDLLQTLNLYLGYFSSSPDRFKILVPAIESESNVFAELVLATSKTEEEIDDFEDEDKLYAAMEALIANPNILNNIISTLADAILEGLLKDTTVQNEFLNQLRSQNYLTPALKNYLTSLFKEYGVENLALIDEINDKAESDILKLLDTFKISAQGGRKASEIIKLAEDALSGAVKSGDLERLQLSDLDAELTNILTLIHRLGDHVGAARTDNGNLDNLYGYNHTVNYLEGLDEEHKLITLTTNVANSMLYDLARLYDHVKYLKGLYDFNSNKKLSEHSKLKTQLTVLKYLKLKTIVIALPEKYFPDKSKILSVLEECTLHNELSGKPILPILDLEKENELLAERIKIENAVNEYFSVMDEEKLELFAENAMNFLGIDRATGLTSAVGYNLEYDLNSESISDRQFWWWLTSCAALRGDMFIRDYNDALAAVDAKIIPIPGLEELIRQAYSKTVNQDMFDKFIQVFNNTCVKEISNLSDDIKDKAIRSLEDVGFAVDSQNLSDSSFAIFYPNTYLFEGSAGSGKTTGTVTTLINMLRLKLRDIFKTKPIFVGLTIEAAEKLARDNGFTPDKDCRCYTHLGYMEFITKDKTYPEDGYKDGDTGKITISNDELINDETTGYHTKYKNVKLNDLLPKEEYPGLIVVDEVTKLSQQDLFVSDDFAKYCGATVVCTGDYKLLSVWGETEKTATMKALVLQTFGTNFISGIKLSQSMRSNNTYKDTNITRLRLCWEDLKTGILEGIAPATALELDYFEETNPESSNYGFYGDKAITIEESGKENLELKLSIQLMLNTLAEGETINVIISDKSSELYKLLERINRGDAVEGIEGTYKDKFTFIYGQAVQGTEGQYYIVDYRTYLSDYKENPELPLKELNTYVSRAKLGTLLVYLNQEIANTNSIYIQNKLLKSLYKTALSELAKLDYKERLMLAIKQYLDSVESIPKTEIKKSGSTGTKSGGSEGSEEPDTEADTKSGKEVNTDEDSEEVQNLGVIVEAGHREVLLDQPSTPGEFNSILWSLGCNKLGCTIKYNGNPINTESDWEKLGDGRRTIAAMDKEVTLVAPADFEERIDNLNGLLRVTGKSYNDLNLEDEDGELTLRETYLAALNRLREAARSMSMEDFLNTLTSILEDLEIDLTDILFSWEIVKKAVNSTDVLTRAHPGEFLESSLTNDSLKARLGIVDRTVDLVIYRKNAEGKMSPILDLELYGFTNPITMLYTEAYSTNPTNPTNPALPLDADKFITLLKKNSGGAYVSCYNLLEVFNEMVNQSSETDLTKKKTDALVRLRNLILSTLEKATGGKTFKTGLKEAVRDPKNSFLSKYYELYCFILMYHNAADNKTIAVPLVDGDLNNKGKSFADTYCKQISSEPISIHRAGGKVRGEGKTEGLEMDQTWISLPKSVLAHAKRNHSRVITLTDQNLAIDINMKAGVPFILYTDRLEFSELDTLQLFEKFIEQELNKNSTKAISFAYITTPGVSVSEYVRNILLRKLAYNKRKNAKEEDVQDYIGVGEDEKLTDVEYDHYNWGNTTTNFRLLQLLVNSEKFEKILEDRAKKLSESITMYQVDGTKKKLEEWKAGDKTDEKVEALLGHYKMLQDAIDIINQQIKKDTRPNKSDGAKLHDLLSKKASEILKDLTYNAVSIEDGRSKIDDKSKYVNTPSAKISDKDLRSLATFITSELEALLLKLNPASAGRPKAKWDDSTKSFKYPADTDAESFIQNKFKCLEELVTKEWSNNGGKILTRLELVGKDEEESGFTVSQGVGNNTHTFDVAYNVTKDSENEGLYRTLLGEDLLVNAKLDTYHAVANVSGIVTTYNTNWLKGGSTLGERSVPNPTPKSAPTLVRTDVKTKEAYNQIYTPASVIMENLKARKYGKFVKEAIKKILEINANAFENPIDLQEALNLINKSGITLDSKENVRILAIRDSEKVPQYTLIPIKLGIDLYTWPVINVGNESFPIKQSGKPKLVSKRDGELVILDSPIEEWHKSLSIPSNGYEFLYGVNPEQLESLDMERYLNTGGLTKDYLTPENLESSSELPILNDLEELSDLEDSENTEQTELERLDQKLRRADFTTISLPGIQPVIWGYLMEYLGENDETKKEFIEVAINPTIEKIKALIKDYLDRISGLTDEATNSAIGAVLIMIDSLEECKDLILEYKEDLLELDKLWAEITTILDDKAPKCQN